MNRLILSVWTALALAATGCGPSFRAVEPNKPMLPSLPSPDQGGEHLLYATFDRATPELRYASSKNGLTWKAVQNGRGYFKAKAAFRDPSIARGPDGVYHCVYTTANAGSIGYISSTDLVNWSAPRWLPVMKAKPATTTTWAPDLLWDSERQEWLLVWSADVAGEFRVDKDDEKFIHRMYACTTRDFKTFSDTWLYFDPGHNVIDPELVEYRGRYVLFYKDERLTPDRKLVLVTEASDPRGPFAPGQLTLPLSPIEGVSALVYPDRMVLYFDAYIDNAMGAMQSTDLVTWTNISSQTWFPPGHRHGSVIRVSPAEYERVLTAPAVDNEPKADSGRVSMARE